MTAVPTDAVPTDAVPTDGVPVSQVGMTPRRQLTLAVAACAAAAGVALYAASRTWLVEVVARPEPLPALTTGRTGGSLVPLLPALALVALAGAGGLLATRRTARIAVAVLIASVGLSIPAILFGLLSRPGVAVGWVVVAMAAGPAVAGVGLLAARRGGSWPTMGSRYEVRGSVEDCADIPSEIDWRQVKGGPGGRGQLADRTEEISRTGRGGAADLWDALDRGKDPTME